ncbi:MAG: ECF transporter S component [Candidatus Bathyarchaeota archaeon]|nr:ECF transporter S component [Candidatus Bathyarchaeota archaeon]
MKTLDITMIGISAALYALVGILTNMGLTAPVVGVVKFWPAVIVPGIFAVLFGPWVGGLGAAIGIFVSDMVQPGHGIALLSLTVGCTSNFAGFYIVGWISRLKIEWRKILLSLLVGSALLTVMIVYLYSIEMLTLDIVAMFLGVLFASDAIVVGFGLWKPEWKTYGLASVVGLLVGSAIIGFGLWAYSQVLTLPLTTGFSSNAPLYASFSWLVWTFATEIPFLVAIVPPVAKVCYRAFPFLTPPNKN